MDTLLVPEAGNTSAYTIQASPNPSLTDGSSWTWTSSPNSTAGSSGTAVPTYLAGVNVDGTQRDTYRPSSPAPSSVRPAGR